MNALRDTRTPRLSTLSVWVATAASIFALVAPASALQQAASPQELFGQALHQETALGDVTAAIALYERVLDHGAADMTTRLRAELRLAGLLVRVGDVASAREHYENILATSSSGQVDAQVRAAARAELATMGEASPSSPDEPRELPHPDVFGAFVFDTSADGRLGAFVSYDGRGGNVGVFDYQTEQITWITDLTWVGGWQAGTFAFATEGHRIAFTQYELSNGTLEVRVAAPGEASRLIRRFEAETAPRDVLINGWLPGSETLVCEFQQQDGTGAIALLGLDGSYTLLHSQPWTGSNQIEASPDGRWIALQAGEEGRHEIAILAVDGSRLAHVTDHPADDRVPFWSPDGRHVLFTSDRNGTPSLWAREVVDGEPVGDPMLVREGLEPGFVRWVGDEMHYLADRNLQDAYTVEVDPETGEIVAPPRLVPYPKTGSNRLNGWSPDGSEIALVSRAGRLGARATIVTQPLNGDPAREFPLHDDLSYPTSVRWTPDGGTISYVARGRSGGRYLARIDLEDGSQTTMRLPDDFNGGFEWSQDGESFWYRRASDELGSRELVEHHLRTGEERVLYTAGQLEPPSDPSRPVGLGRPALSHDGAELWIPDSGRLVVYELETGEARVAASDWPEDRPSWSPDGRFAAILRPRDGEENPDPRQSPPLLSIVDAATREVKVLDLDPAALLRQTVGIESRQVSFNSHAWSPVDNRIAFTIQLLYTPRMVLPNPLPAVLDAEGMLDVPMAAESTRREAPSSRAAGSR